MNDPPRPSRIRWVACSLLPLLLPSHAELRPAGPPPPQASGATVFAKVRIQAPSVPRFVLRATLPVPPGLWTGRETSTPFQLRDQDGRLTPAQVEIVSRYAVLRDGADVVEILSSVQLPAGSVTGASIVYDVLLAPAPLAPFVPDPQVEGLVEAGVFLETRDVFGNLYRANLMRDLRTSSSDLRVLRSGQAAHQVRTHEVLTPVTPVTGSTGTLPHHVGVHSYVTRWSGDQVVSLDLRIYNGGSGRNAHSVLDDPNREVYFDQLRLRLPLGWNALSAFSDPFRGADVTEGGSRMVSLVAPLPGNQLHMMPMQANLSRRLVLYREGYLGAARAIANEQTLGFCEDGTSPLGERLSSWWNPGTARYFAQRQPLPRLDAQDLGQMRISMEQNFENLREAVATGTPAPWPFTVPSRVLGWAHPYGHVIGYAHGGEEIEYFPGADVAFLASRAGYRTFQLLHRMYNARHATTLYDSTGEPTRLESWLRPGGPTGLWNSAWVWIKPVLWLGDPFGFTTAPPFQVDAVAAMGRKPDYEPALLSFQHIGEQHLVRYTRPLKVLAWLGNDALAKDDLLMQAELVRLTYSNFPNDPYGSGIATGMFLVSQYVDQYPNQGARLHRGQGWEIDTVAHAYAIARPDWRIALEAWADRMVDLLEKAQDSCTGILGSTPNPYLFGGLFRNRQSISESILENGIWAMRSSIYAERRPQMQARLDQLLIRSGYAMISDAFWNSEQDQPHFYTAVGPYDVMQPPFCSFVRGHDSYENYQGWPTLAYSFRLTGDGAFLTKALEMAGGNVTAIPSLGAGFLQNAAPVMALFQELGL